MVKITFVKRIFKYSPFDEEKEIVKTKTLVLPARLVSWWLSKFDSVSYDDQNRTFEAGSDDTEITVKSVSTLFGKKKVFLDRMESGYMLPDQWERQSVMREIFRPILNRDRFGHLDTMRLSMPSFQLISWEAEHKVVDGEFATLPVGTAK